ncbi:unnamed protein product [[Candida] boidinii]|uniref:Unnamed protein product n=1 Tax=Candida boidinii TaxID=5477 RepID=A0A9W6SZK5_CANBO|nr:hypothetical protein B5S30_g4419 [[Candida] boidinii]OWB85670.1 hypothetical protein B5S33_g4339 [[Candida] boidinii]GME70948.1 unnamed protein product [[Candida] boidinii]
MEPSTAHAIVNFLSNIKISPKSGGGNGSVSNANSTVEDSGVYMQQNGYSTDACEGNDNAATDSDFVIDSSSGTGEILFNKINKRRLSNDSVNSTNSNGGSVAGGILACTNNSKIVKYPRRLSNDGLHSHGLHHRHHHSQRHINNKSIIKRNSGNNSSSNNGNSIIISGVRPNQFDKQGLFDRINSYNITNWNIEEEELNPLVCSLYGWKCDSSRRSRNRKNELECVSCHARLLIKLDSDAGNSNSNNYDILKILNGSDDEEEDEEEQGEFYDDGDEHLSYSEMVRKRLVKNYLQLLKSTGHYSFCSWYFKSMSMNYYKISINDINDIMNNLEKNFINLIKFKKFFQFKKIKKTKKFEEIESNFEINQKILKDLLLNSKSRENKENKDIDYNDNIYIKLILISLLNWEIKFQKFGYKVIILLKCNKCTRRILIGELSEDEFEKIMNMRDDRDGDGNNDDTYSNLILPEVNTRPMIITEQKTEFDLNLEKDNSNNSNDSNDNHEYVSMFDDNVNGQGQGNSVDEYDEYDDEEEEGVIDLVNEHHRWCCIINESSNSEILGYELIYEMLKMSIKTDEILPQSDSNTDNVNIDGDIDMTIDEEIEFGDKSVNLSLSNLDKLRNKII